MKTMTTQESLLALAKAVYGEFAHYNNSDLREDCRGLFIHRHGRTVKFDPANNSEQAMEVLCWLLSPALAMSNPQKEFFTLTSWNIQRSRWIEEYELEPVTCWSVGYNGTPASLRAAIVQAACRVVQS